MHQDIKLTDFSRILFGDAPPEFLLEVFIRTILVYLELIVVMRWLGKRMNGKLSLTEMAVVLTLGAIVSVPMQSPDRGLLQGLIVLTCALLFQRGLNLWAFIYKKIELITQGKMRMLVKDGIIQLPAMRKERVSNQQLFALLRSKKIYQLGQIQRVYLEASGLFSIYEAKEKAPGLSTLPDNDQELRGTQQEVSGVVTCTSCGFVRASNERKKCSVCNRNKLIPARL